MTDGPVVNKERMELAVNVRRRSLHVKLVDGLGRVGDGLALEMDEALRQAYAAGLCDGYLQGSTNRKES